MKFLKSKKLNSLLLAILIVTSFFLFSLIAKAQLTSKVTSIDTPLILNTFNEGKNLFLYVDGASKKMKGMEKIPLNKIESPFVEDTEFVFGMGTGGRLARWVENNLLSNSALYDNGSYLSLGSVLEPSHNYMMNIKASENREGLRIVASNYSPLNIQKITGSQFGGRENIVDIFRVNQDGVLEAGNIPWARLNPSSCSSGTVAVGIGGDGLNCIPIGLGGGGDITGSGTTGYVVKWTDGGKVIGNSIVYESSNGIGIGITNPSHKLEVSGSTKLSSLTVSGATNLVGALTTNGISTFQKNVIMNSDLNIGHDLKVGNYIYGKFFSYESSDIRLKENVNTISGALDKINSLRGVSFKWRDSEIESYGLIAQELEEVFPEMVAEFDGYKAVQYSALIAPLIEAVKEQSREIKALEARIEALELAR